MAQPPDDANLLPAAVAAGWIREYQGDRDLFVKLLVHALEATVPDRLAVRTSGGWLGRPRAIRGLRLDLDDYRYQLDVEKGGALTASRAHVVRGVALKTERLAVPEWLESLSAALVEYARANEAALAALKRHLG